MITDVPTLKSLEALGPTRAAALWLERLHRDDLDDAADGAFQQWLDASEANRAAWDDAIDLWASFDDAEDPVFDEMRRAALVLRPRRRANAWRLSAVAAALAVIASSVVLLHSGTFESGSGEPKVARADGPDLRGFGKADYATAKGRRAEVALGDGSTLRLGSETAVDIAFANGLRMVRLLRGSASFDVAHDAAHPFRVAADGTVISVLGTKFDVRLARDEARILLQQGSIAVAAGDDPARFDAAAMRRLKAGQELIIRAGQPDEIRSAGGDAAAVGHRPRFVQFDGDTLAAAAQELNRHAGKKLVIRDPRVAALRVSGAFPAGDTESFVQTLTALHPVRAIPRSDGTIELVWRR